MGPDDSYHRVFKNSLILTFLRIIEPLLSMAVIIALSRVKGAEMMGAYAFIISFVGLFSLIGQMGLQTLITREVAGRREEAASFLCGALVLGLGSSAILALAMNLSKGYFKLTDEVSYCVFLTSFNLFPIFVIAAFEAVFMGFERSDLIIYQQLSGNLTRVGLSLAFILLGWGLTSLVLAILTSTLLSAVVCAITYFRFSGSTTLIMDFDISWRLLKSSPVFLLITLAWIMWARVDMLILTRFTNMTQVALYAAAYKLFEATMIIPQSYMKASFPHLSALRTAGAGSFQKANRDTLTHALFYVFPVTAFMVLLSPFLVALLFGDKFVSSGHVLQILMIGLIPWTIGRTFANILTAADLQKYDLLSILFAGLAGIGLNLRLTPQYGAQGAAMASAASLSIFFFCQFCFAKKAGYSVSLVRACGRPFLLGLIAFVMVWIGRIGWVVASIEAAVLATASMIYFRRSENRKYLKKPLVLLQSVMRA